MKTDPETELTQLPGDRVDREIRDAELARRAEDGSIRINVYLDIRDPDEEEP